MSAAHTRSPWKSVTVLRGKYRGDIGIKPPGELDPIFCYLAKGRDDIQAANARLICAAPDLLQAVRKAEEWLCDARKELTPEVVMRMKSVIAECQIAIAKATL